MPGQDFMTTLPVWTAIQNGAAPTEAVVFDDVHRYMRNGRDTAAYTQADELYQAYLIAFLVANTLNLMANPGSPYFGFVNDQAFGNIRWSRYRRDTRGRGPRCDQCRLVSEMARASAPPAGIRRRHRAALEDRRPEPVDAAKLGNFDIVLNSEALKRSFASAMAVICCRKRFRRDRRPTPPIRRDTAPWQGPASPC